MEASEGEHLSNIQVDEFEHITKNGGMCVIKVSFSQSGWFHWSMMEWKATDHDNTMEYAKPFIPLKVTATCNILNHTPNNSISHLPCIVVYHNLCSQNMSTNGSPLKAVNMAPPNGLFGNDQRHEDNSESSENCSGTATGKECRFGTYTNQYHLPHGYGCLSSQQPFPGAPQFYRHSPFNMTHSLQQTTSANQGFPSYRPQWQGYNLHQGGDGRSQMFPPPQIPQQMLSSPGAPRVPPGPPENHPVNWPTAFGPNHPAEPPSGAPGRPLISLPTEGLQPPAEPRKTDVAGIQYLPRLQENSLDDYDADDDSDDSSDSGGTEGNPPITLNQTKFTLKQSAKEMGQGNYSVSNKRKKVWVVGFLEMKHPSIIRGQIHLTQLWDGPLHRETAVADYLVSFKDGLPLDDFNNAKWIRWQWVEMFLKKRASEIREARKRGTWSKKRLVTEMGERVGKKVRSPIPELPNTTFTVVIHWVSNGKDTALAPKQLQALYTDVRHWEELNDIIDQNGGPNEPSFPTSIFNCTSQQDKLDEEHMGLYTHWQMIINPIYGQISYNCSLSNAFKLKLRHNPETFLVNMKRATGKGVAEQVMRSAKVIPTRCVKARCG